MKERLIWFNIYTYFYLPLTIISFVLILFNITVIHIYNFSMNASSYLGYLPRWVIILVALSIIVLNSGIVVGFVKRKLLAWKLNFISLVLLPLLSSLSTYKGISNYIAYILIGMIMWILPNVLYFLRRKELFN
jgi:hypothetical protein